METALWVLVAVGVVGVVALLSLRSIQARTDERLANMRELLAFNRMETSAILEHVRKALPPTSGPSGQT